MSSLDVPPKEIRWPRRAHYNGTDGWCHGIESGTWCGEKIADAALQSVLYDAAKLGQQALGSVADDLARGLLTSIRFLLEVYLYQRHAREAAKVGAPPMPFDRAARKARAVPAPRRQVDP